MPESHNDTFSESVLARVLKIRNRFDAKQRLRQGAIFSLAIAGLGFSVAIAEPGPLHEPVITISNEDSDHIITFSEGDRLGSFAILGGVGFAAVAGYGLSLIRKEEIPSGLEDSSTE